MTVSNTSELEAKSTTGQLRDSVHEMSMSVKPKQVGKIVVYLLYIACYEQMT